MKTIAIPFGRLMLWLYEWTGSYALAITLFALVVSVIMLPFMAKSKKSMMRTTRLQPRIAELQRKHEGNQQKLNMEMQKLYRDEKINPMSGCLWSLIPFPILIALYYAIRMPITTMMGVPEALLAKATETAAGPIYQKLMDLGYTLADYGEKANAAYEQIYQSKFITEHFADFAPLSDKLIPMDYGFLNLDLSAQPSFRVWQFDWSNAEALLPALGLFLIPIISAFMSWLSMKISTSMNPQNADNPQMASTNKSMALMMPLMSLWIGFVMPAALGLYWIINSVVGIVREIVLTKIYTKRMDKEDAERKAERDAREAELEAKRAETERLKALNATNVNSNTSKKKMQAAQKAEREARRAAAEKAEREARRKRLGIELPEEPASQVGNRRYARGRAYVEDRYINPEGAEEATAAAAAESEYGESIDSAVEDDVMDTVIETDTETAADTDTEDGGNYDSTFRQESAEGFAATDDEEEENT